VSRELAIRLLLSLSILTLGLVAALVILLSRSSGPAPLTDALSDDAVRDEVIERLVAESNGIFDSFPDPDVGRLMQPGLNRTVRSGGLVTSNLWGLREVEYPLIKPDGTIRVVLLGDSYVYGNGVAPDERLGHHLSDMLRRGGVSSDVECLHLGIPSWNLVAESQFVRRQLSRLRPDLVIQVAVPNDLDALAGVRGFGVMAAASPQHARRAGSVVGRHFARTVLGIPTNNLLVHGLDHESRERYREAAESMRALADAIESMEGRYLLLLNWMNLQSVALEQFRPALGAERIVAMPASFYTSREHRVSATDGHWNEAGHREVARYLYACIEAKGLLAGIELAPDPEASSLRERWNREVEAEVAAFEIVDSSELLSSMSFHRIEPAQARQIHGGIFPQGSGPYASVLLRNDGASRLILSGNVPGDPAMKDAKFEVYLEGLLLRSERVHPGQVIDWEIGIPPDLEDRDVLNVRWECDDYVYRGRDQRTMISFLPREVALR
jgi:lysophospholipase L1-like esterase